MNLLFILLFVYKTYTYEINNEKEEFCANLNCENVEDKNVCGLREEGEGYRIRIFLNECELLKYGCRVSDKDAYGIINMEYCEKTFFNDTINNMIFKSDTKNDCAEYDCSYAEDTTSVCGIRTEGKGVRIKLFPSKCQLWKYNCEQNLHFVITDYYICDGLKLSDNLRNGKENKVFNDQKEYKNSKNLFVIGGSLLNNIKDINNTIDNFFAATHVIDLPIEELGKNALNNSIRRMLLKNAAPIKVFQPWTVIPKNISEDYYHTPTLSSCYHKCPTKCPDTYAPVCGVPGRAAREPSLMFQNHCFMDVAQCKMRWEDKSSTSISSSYIESTFLFCLGDKLNNLYRFLPLVKTLQHMGRLKKKGHFRYKLRNLRFFNNLLSGEPKLMG